MIIQQKNCIFSIFLETLLIPLEPSEIPSFCYNILFRFVAGVDPTYECHGFFISVVISRAIFQNLVCPLNSVCHDPLPATLRRDLQGFEILPQILKRTSAPFRILWNILNFPQKFRATFEILFLSLLLLCRGALNRHVEDL